MYEQIVKKRLAKQRIHDEKLNYTPMNLAAKKKRKFRDNKFATLTPAQRKRAIARGKAISGGQTHRKDRVI